MHKPGLDLMVGADIIETLIGGVDIIKVFFFFPFFLFFLTHFYFIFITDVMM